jgi:hypothetical protein
MSDSLKLDVTGRDKERLALALDLAHINDVTGIWQDGNKLVLSWCDEKRYLSFPPRIMADVIMDWLGRSPGSNARYCAPDYGKKPDIDGSCARGWRLVCDDMERSIEIHPHWMVYSK